MNSIRTRILALTATVLLLAGTVGLLALDRLYRINLENVNERLLLAAEDQFRVVKEAEVEKLYVTIETVAADPEMTDAFLSAERERLLALAWPIHEHLRDFHQINRWYYHSEGADGVARVFLRVYQGDDALDPEQSGDEVQSPVLDEARANRIGAAGFVMGRSRLSLRATEPLFGADGEIVGYLSLGQGVTELVERISGQTGDAYAMFLDKALLDRDAWTAGRTAEGLADGWDERAETVLVASTLDDDSMLDGVDIDTVPREAIVVGTTERAGRTFAEGIFPILDFQEKPVGAVLVLHDITDVAESMRAAQLGLLLAVLAVSLVGAGAVGFTLDRLIFHRLDRFIRFAEDLSLSAVSGRSRPPRSADVRDDEIGRFERYMVEYAETVATAVGRRDAARREEAPVEEADLTADGTHEERTRG